MKNAIRSAGFVLALVLAISYAYHVVSWKDTAADYLSSIQQMYHTDSDLMDVVFLGSSHTFCAISPATLWEDYGMSAFSMSVSGQHRSSTYYQLKEVLKTQSPKIVITDLYGLLFDRNAVIGNVYRNMLSMKWSKNSIDLVNAYVDKDERLDYYLRWPIVHTRYRELGMYDFYQYPVSVYGRGESLTWSSASSYELSDAISSKEVGELSEANAKWLDDMRELSEEEGFTLIFYIAPFAVNDEEQKILNAAKEYADKNNIDVYDFNLLADEIGLDPFADMCDSHHANGYGAIKITKYFGKVLSEKYDLADHRGDEAYHLWDEDLRFFKHRYAKAEIQNTINVYDYIRYSMDVDDMIIVLSLDGEFENIIPELVLLGLSEEEMQTGGKWLFKDGSWVKLMDNIPGESRTFELSKFDAVKVQCTPNAPDMSVLYGRKSVVGTANGLNILVYDSFTDELIGSRCVDN